MESKKEKKALKIVGKSVEKDAESEMEALSMMVAQAAAAAKVAANMNSFDFLDGDGSDIATLDPTSIERLASTSRPRIRSTPIPMKKPSLPPIASRDGKSRFISSSWFKDKQMANVTNTRRSGESESQREQKKKSKEANETTKDGVSRRQPYSNTRDREGGATQRAQLALHPRVELGVVSQPANVPAGAAALVARLA